MKARALEAMRATHLPVRAAGLWYINRVDVPEYSVLRLEAGYRHLEGPATLTSLMRWTTATLHRGHGDSVMSDEPRELRRHLPIVMQASGRVLVTGLGLGCVVRGLLCNPDVCHIDVVEVDAHVLELVGWSFQEEPRVQLHHGDALTYRWPRGTRWDYAWHDVWVAEGALDLLHAELLVRYERRVRQLQGAWQLDRDIKARLPLPLVNQKGRTRRALAVRA